MPREIFALHADDISAFAKSLRQQLTEYRSQADESDAAPSHLSLLNMLARAAGHRNIQALRAAAQQPAALAQAPTKLTPVHAPPARGPSHPELSELADRALRQFDAQGRLVRWPSRHQVQRYAIWGMWLHFDSRRVYTEPEVNEVLNAHHGFGDHCTLRRELVEMKLLARSDGGRAYRKLAARPNEDLLPLLRELRVRSGAA
ncbi:DUF2087 domain-containing protein [Roseateles oligotrophus]|uniref:DUF2087 domain-containing protein n=1 Tax=Roseateles oligotrophus TaxID=1769250 RepID=A0ABT2YKJ4_9BURK|nr:DUF2087 domain-containing protein [Roseateles oligotrophus]MCV2370584.1 DUF2087 domain-containing protein [Roseateles oligotrophus]